MIKMNSERKLKKLEKKLQEIKEVKKKEKELKDAMEEKREMPAKKLGVNEKIDRLTEIIEGVGTKQKTKKKKFKLPSKIENSAKKFHKKNKIIVFLVKRNKSFIAITTEIYKGMVYIGEDWHGVPVDSIMMWNSKTPCIVLPEFDLVPLSPDKLYGEAVEENRIVDPQTIIIRAIKNESVGGLKKLGGKGLVWIIIGAVAAIWVIFGGSQ